METIVDDISYFLEDYLGGYYNPHNVIIDLQSDGRVELVVVLAPAKSKAAVEINFETHHVRELINCFGLQSTKDLGKITRDHLQGLYEQGRASVFCDIADNNDYVLFKQICGHCVMVLADDTVIPVTESLITYKDYIKYTKRYYSAKGKYPVN